MRKGRIALSLLILASASSASAQDCMLPLPFGHAFANRATAALAAPSPGDPCILTASLDATPSPTSAAVLHYTRPSPATSLRFGFRIDTSGLIDFTSAAQVAQVFSASAPVVLADPLPQSQLLFVTLADGAKPALKFYAARGGGNPAAIAIAELAQSPATLRIEINVGAGTAGSVRYWIDATFDEPPTGTIDASGAGLDNAAWVGVIAAEIGLSSPSSNFRTSQGGNAVVFDQIESNDDLLFWDGFEGVAQ